MAVRRVVAAYALAGGLLLAIAGCGSGGGAVSPSAGQPGGATTAVRVVASTDVWGDVVRQIAGRLAGSRVTIDSIITDPAADPHSYEASPQNQLALSRADLVVENGGGYDDFVATMLKSAGNARATILDAVDISGRTPPAGGELNEHVWYDFPSVQKVAERITTALVAVDPTDAAAFRSNAATFASALSTLETTEASIRQASAGQGVAITEPVPLYLLDACGLVNRTPPAFSAAIEDGTDVPPLVLKQTQDLFAGHQVAVLAYNEQTSGPETEAVLRAAKANHVPVVPVTETLPAGQDYLTWMRSNLSALQAALR